MQDAYASAMDGTSSRAVSLVNKSSAKRKASARPSAPGAAAAATLSPASTADADAALRLRGGCGGDDGLGADINLRIPAGGTGGTWPPLRLRGGAGSKRPRADEEGRPTDSGPGNVGEAEVQPGLVAVEGGTEKSGGAQAAGSSKKQNEAPLAAKAAKAPAALPVFSVGTAVEVSRFLDSRPSCRHITTSAQEVSQDSDRHARLVGHTCMRAQQHGSMYQAH